MTETVDTEDFKAAVSLVRLEGQLNTLAGEMKATINGLSDSIQMTQSASNQNMRGLQQTLDALNQTQKEQGQNLRKLDSVPEKIVDVNARIISIETRVTVLERNKYTFMGFLLGASTLGGVIGASLTNLLMGG